MSSLMQFRGETGQRGVRLEFYLHPEDASWNDPPAEPVECSLCHKMHERLYVAWRKPAGMFGPWVVFRYNGKEHVPDLSIPIAVERIPRDAIPLSDEQNSEAWHRT